VPRCIISKKRVCKAVDTRNKGKSGEDIAVQFLKRRGYRILERNFRTKFGEIDIIARDRKTTVFIEVKLRESISSGYPSESVVKAKMYHLQNTALSYLKIHNLSDTPYRFEVVSILKDGNLYKIDLIPLEF